MPNYIPLKDPKGIQTGFSQFQFSWSPATNDSRAHFLWIYKEDELGNPRMINYARCLNNRTEILTFQSGSVRPQEIRRVRFLVFLSDEQRGASQNDLERMWKTPEFNCMVCCGNAQVSWRWDQEAQGVRLSLASDRMIPEGILYYEYPYGGRMLCFEIPGTIRCGENSYGGIFFPPDLSSVPILKSREENVKLSPMGKQKKQKSPKGQEEGPNPAGNKKKNGLIQSFADRIRPSR